MAATAKKQDEPEPVLVRASARFVRVSPRKARLVADQVRGRQRRVGGHSDLDGMGGAGHGQGQRRGECSHGA